MSSARSGFLWIRLAGTSALHADLLYCLLWVTDLAWEPLPSGLLLSYFPAFLLEPLKSLKRGIAGLLVLAGGGYFLADSIGSQLPGSL